MITRLLSRSFAKIPSRFANIRRPPADVYRAETSVPYIEPPKNLDQLVPIPATSELVCTEGLHRILSQPYVAIKRRLEVLNVVIGFEQANHYTIYDKDGNILGYMIEDNSTAKTVVRNVLKNHRPFTATIMDPESRVIMKITRPFYLINSSMQVENGVGGVIGEINQIWHLWRRKYELFVNKKQFGQVDTPLLSWEFNVEDENGNILSAVDKHFAGLGTVIQTLFTDAHTYIVHFSPGSPLYDFSARASYESAAIRARREAIEQSFQQKPGENKQISESKIASELEKKENWSAPLMPVQQIGRELSFEEKAVVLGAAMAIDFDYFSRNRGGMPLPLFIPMGGIGGHEAAGDVAAGAAVGAGMDASANSDNVDTGNSVVGGEESNPWKPDSKEEIWQADDPNLGTGSDSSSDGGGGLWDMITSVFDD